jgi:HSP20 family molecular chaperone IbpA
VVTYLPFAVLASEATAEYQDGFLTVQLPRVTAAPVMSGSRYQPAVAQRGGQ